MMREGEPALPDRSPSASRVTFEWPCERREAHAPHPRTLIGWTGGLGAVREFVNDPKAGPTTQYPDPVYSVGGGLVTSQKECPGVKAHPTTMIGGGYERC